MKKPRLFFGLRYERAGEWWVVMARETSEMTAGARISLAWRILRVGVAVAISRFRPGELVARTEWRSRMRACRRCPVYCRELRRCRPYDGAEEGCGCYVPLLAMVKRPYGSGSRGCWVRQEIPGTDLGWE